MSNFQYVAKWGTAKLGIASIATRSKTPLQLYPNPNKGSFTITCTLPQSSIGHPHNIDIYDMTGRQVFHTVTTPSVKEWKNEIQVSQGLSNGRYELRLSGTGVEAEAGVLLVR